MSLERCIVARTYAECINRLRLVMPPLMFSVLSFPMTQLAHLLFPPSMANGIISGAFVFCECTNSRCGRLTSFIYFRCPLRLHALRVSSLSLGTIPPFAHSPQQPPPHETPRLRSRAEEVPPCAPLQELRPRLRRDEQALGLRLQHCSDRLEACRNMTFPAKIHTHAHIISGFDLFL